MTFSNPNIPIGNIEKYKENFDISCGLKPAKNPWNWKKPKKPVKSRKKKV